jgi:SAM-dependent methyltransferase
VVYRPEVSDARDFGPRRPGPRSFDRAFYDRFYRDPSTRVAGPGSVRALGRFVCAYVDYLGIEVRRVLDLGCGLGFWREVIAEHYPEASYHGVEVSEHLCKELGWERGSVVDYRGEPADLVICHGVLQYLGAREARGAIVNLAQLTRGALYLEALTREDWQDNCDQSVTDGNVHLRPAAWYRRWLGKELIACGGGVFLPRDTDIVLFELEHGE